MLIILRYYFYCVLYVLISAAPLNFSSVLGTAHEPQFLDHCQEVFIQMQAIINPSCKLDIHLAVVQPIVFQGVTETYTPGGNKRSVN